MYYEGEQPRAEGDGPSFREQQARQAQAKMACDAGGQTAPRKRTIQDAHQQQAGVIAETMKMFTVLAQRLAPVLEAEGPSAESNQKDPRPESSLSVIERIDKHTHAIAAIAERINSVSNRIQL